MLPFPRIALGRFPSPLEWHDSLGRALGFDTLAIKREDLNADTMGGNKVRALEWLLPRAGSMVTTFGGYGSTHAAATAVHARRAGRRATVVLFPQPWSSSVELMLRRSALNGHVVLAASRSAVAVKLGSVLLGSGPRPSWIPPGAASPLGVLGSVLAGTELAGQVAADVFRPDVIVVPLGSGGTTAGLRLGLALAGWRVPVCAVPVADWFVANRATVQWLVWRTRRLLAKRGVPVPSELAPLHVMDGLRGAGYGHPTESGLRSREQAALAGLDLDLTYGAKAFAALDRLRGSFRRPCFWHTFDTRSTPPTPEVDTVVDTARLRAEALWPAQTKST